MNEMLSVMRSSWSNFLDLLRRFIPQVFAMLLIVIAGWVIGKVASAFVRYGLHILRLDALLEKTGTAELLRKANAPPLGRMIGKLTFWLVWLAFLLSGMRTVGFSGTDLLIADLVRLVPRVLVAIVILVAGVAISNFLWRATLLAAVNAKLTSAPLLGGFVRAIAFVATGVMALEQLDIARAVMEAAFVIAFGAVMLAAAIAFGLGGRHLARRFLEDKLTPRREASSGEANEPPHL
jgi:hypothetical protein